MADIEKFVYYNNGSKKVLKPTDRIVVGSGGLAFEGTTSDDFELHLAVVDPTEDRTITFPNDTGEVALVKNGVITADDFKGDLNGAIRFEAKNTSGATINKGQAVYVTGVSGDTKPTVSLAQANSSSTMPAFGLARDSIDNNATGEIITFGNLTGVATGTFNITDTLYISADNAGEIVNTPPAGSSNLIQNIGKVIRSHSSNGTIKVGGAGRTNATPNLNEGKFFIGNSSNQSTQSSYQLPSSITNNAILVANSDGSSVLSTDLLTIDTSNDRVGIGTSSPARTLHLVGDVQYEGSMRIDQYHTSTDGPDVLMQKARGTPSTPVASQDGDELGKFVFYGHDGTNFQESASFVVTDNGSQGAEIQLKTTVSGDASPSERFEINSSGVITFNNSYSFPTSDGTSGQVLTTNGSGALSFADVSGGISNLVEDTTPQLGGTLDLNSQSIQGNLIPSAVDTYSLGSIDAEWSDLYLGDSSRIYFGNDQDVFLEHDPDAGIILDMSLDPALTPRFTIKNANTGVATGGEIEFLSETASPAGNDIIGTITSTANNSASSLHEYTAVRSKIISPTNSIESSGLYFYTSTGGLPAGNVSTEGLSIEGNTSGHVKVDIPLHNATDSGLTLGGTLIKSTAEELNVLDVSTESPSDSDVLTYTTANGLHWTAGSSVDLTSVSASITPSAAGTYNLGSSNAEWDNLYLGDSSYIYFGNDQDVRLQHIPDSGLTLSMGSSQSAYDPTFTIQSSTSNTNGIGPQIKLQKMYTDPGDIVGDIYFQGYYSAVYDVYGRIKVRAPAQTHGNLQLSVLSGNVETVAIDIIGDSTSSTTEIVNSGPIATKVTSSDPSVRGSHAHIYSKDVSGSAEMFVQDEAGNVTQISPHNEEGDWVYWSENKKTGKKVKVNMEKMIRRLEEITGESFFEEYIEGT